MCRKLVLVAVLALALGVESLLPASAQVKDQGGGVGIYPVFIEIKDAMRGGRYPRTITLINNEAWDFTFQMELQGEVGKWVSVSTLDEPKVPLKEVPVRAKTQARLMLQVTVPQDSPNGPHVGSISFLGDVPTAEGSKQPDKSGGTSVAMGVATDVKVEVTGTQKLAGLVRDIGVDDVEMDQPPLRVRTMFENTGNVNATPLIRLQVRDAAGAVLGEVSQGDTVVPPQSGQEIRTEWDNSNQRVGDYTANVVVLLSDSRIDDRTLPFRILPRGTLTSSGVLVAIDLSALAEVGSQAKVVARFRNTGRIDAKAVFIAEILREGSLVKVVESRERVIPAGDQGLIELYFDIPQAGQYTLRGKVNYNGKETASADLNFTMLAAEQAREKGQAQPQPQPQPQTDSYALVAGLLLGALVVVILALVAALRRRPAADTAGRSRLEMPGP